jgi:lysophospholipase L1-like esterase
VSERGPGRGLVALGDSITRGSGDAMVGLRMQSWALWLAEALSLPYTCLAADGARARDVIADQLPRLRGPYDLGCVYIGINDVRAPGFEPERFAGELAQIVAAVGAQARLLMLVALPSEIGAPPAPAAAIARARAAIAELGRDAGAVILPPGPPAGPELLLPDAVHLTARGQVALALRACEQLRARGIEADTTQLERMLEPLRPTTRLRWLLGPYALNVVRDRRRRAVEAVARARSGS